MTRIDDISDTTNTIYIVKKNMALNKEGKKELINWKDSFIKLIIYYSLSHYLLNSLFFNLSV